MKTDEELLSIYQTGCGNNQATGLRDVFNAGRADVPAKTYDKPPSTPYPEPAYSPYVEDEKPAKVTASVKSKSK